MVQNTHLTGRPPKLTRMDDLVINFTEEDAWQVHHPHNNDLGINMTIADYDIQRVLIDNESSTDIIYYLAF